VEKPADQMLRSMLQFLTLKNEEKLAFLPPTNDSDYYIINACADRTRNPLFYYCNAAYELMDRYWGGDLNEFSQLICEIDSLLAFIIETKESYSYIWYLDKVAYSISGPADLIWSVLRRLALAALAARSWPAGPPEIPFSETGYSGVRQASVDKWEPGKWGSTDSKEW
jgi:hypothetical protein